MVNLLSKQGCDLAQVNINPRKDFTLSGGPSDGEVINLPASAKSFDRIVSSDYGNVNGIRAKRVKRACYTYTRKKAKFVFDGMQVSNA